MEPYSESNNPVLEKEQVEDKFKCEYDGKLYPQSQMYYDMYHNGTGGWIAKVNIEAFANRELPLHEQKEYINIIRQENEIKRI